MEAELEVINLLIKTCQAVRNPVNKKNRLELASPATRWEVKLVARKRVLEKKMGVPSES